MSHNELLQRIKGVLIGGALGDAMGMPTELWTQKMVFEEFPYGVKDFHASINKSSIIRKMEAGQITDDTINTLFILEMLTNNQGKVTVTEYVDRLMHWSKESSLAALVSGPSTMRALDQIAKGVPLTETGRFGTTNGGVMKIAPIGIVSDYTKMDDLVEKVYQICMPTHNTSIAIAGASAGEAVVSYVTSGGKSIEAMWEIAKQAIECGWKKGYNVATPSFLKRLDYAKKIVEHYDEKLAMEKLYEELGTGVETIETIPSVFAVITLAKGNPIKAAQISASLGGDTDTIGAIATSICGGMHPEIDTQFIDTLEAVNHIDFDQLAKGIVKYSPFYSA